MSEACASFAHTLGYEVIVCDPRDEELAKFRVPGVEVRQVLPSLYLVCEGCHAATAVVALTHDPRIDDLALMEAIKTPVFAFSAQPGKCRYPLPVCDCVAGG